MAAGVADGAAEATAGRPSSAGPVLSLRAYSTGFDTGAGRLTVVDTIDLDVARGEVIALVGESGSGKSVVCRSFIGLAGANSWRRGSASLCGIDLMTASERDFVRLRGAKAAMIFQDPVASLDPATSSGILSLLHSICKEDGIPAIVSLHQVELAKRFADRVVGLSLGRVVYDGGPAGLCDQTLDNIYSCAALAA